MTDVKNFHAITNFNVEHNLTIAGMIVCWKLVAIFARAIITPKGIMAELVTATFINTTLIHICAMPQAGIKKRMVKINKIVKR